MNRGRQKQNQRQHQYFTFTLFVCGLCLLYMQIHSCIIVLNQLNQLGELGECSHLSNTYRTIIQGLQLQLLHCVHDLFCALVSFVYLGCLLSVFDKQPQSGNALRMLYSFILHQFYVVSGEKWRDFGA